MLQEMNQRIAVGLLLLAIAGGVPLAAEEKSPDVVTLIQITDTHVSNMEKYHPAIVERRKEYGAPPLEEFFRSLPGEVPPTAIVITGDVIDSYEGQTEDLSMSSGQVDHFAKLYDLSPVPLLLTLGNHDISSYLSGVYPGQKTTLYDYDSKKARAGWIRTIPCYKEGVYYSRSYRAGQTKYRLLFLDNSFRIPGPLSLWDRQQLHWIRNQLLEAKGEVVIFFFHIPLPVADTNQDNVHFRIPDPGWLETEVYSDGILNILNSYPSVVAGFTGHGHRSIIEDMRLPAGHTFTQIETGAFGNDPSNWRIIKLLESEITVSATGSEEVEKRITIAKQDSYRQMTTQ